MALTVRGSNLISFRNVIFTSALNNESLDRRIDADLYLLLLLLILLLLLMTLIEFQRRPLCLSVLFYVAGTDRLTRLPGLPGWWMLLIIFHYSYYEY